MNDPQGGRGVVSQGRESGREGSCRDREGIPAVRRAHGWGSEMPRPGPSSWPCWRVSPGPSAPVRGCALTSHPASGMPRHGSWMPRS